MKYIYTYIFLLLLTTFIACKKKNASFISYRIFNTGETINLKKIIFKASNTCFTCGGLKNKYGAIFKSDDAAETWKKVFSENKYCINDIFFLNDSVGFACGDSLTLFKTNDGGENWVQYTFPNLPWDQYMIPFNSIYAKSETEIFLAGGEHYSKGCITRTYNAGGVWNHPSFDNEFDCIFFTDSNTAYISGYGVIYKTTDNAHNFFPLNIRGDWYVSLYFFNNHKGFAAGYNGGIYKTEDGGETWKTVLSSNNSFENRKHIHSILFTDINKGYASASDGILYFSEDGGNNWNFSVLNQDEKLNSICLSPEKIIYICSDKGNIYRLDE